MFSSEKLNLKLKNQIRMFSIYNFILNTKSKQLKNRKLSFKQQMKNKKVVGSFMT